MSTCRRAHLSVSLASALVIVLGSLVGNGAAVAADMAWERDPKASKIPKGVWSGPGAIDGVYDVLVVRDGPKGAQPVFFAESHSSTCEWGPAVLSGTVGLDGGELVLSGDVVCVDSGEVGFRHAELVFTTGDDFPDSISPEGFHYGPWLRRCDGSGATVEGTSGDDVLEGTSGNDVIDGLGGDDVIDGKGGMDVLCGGDGKDRLVGGGDIDVLVGGGGNDRLNGGPGWDLLLGEGGKDRLKGGGDGDFMFGDAKHDKINGGSGPDYADGGAGKDNCKAETRVSCANAYVVTSADGVVTLEMPNRDIEVSVRKLGAAELPDDLDDAPIIGPVYALEPDGAMFDKPVKVTVRLPISELGGSDTQLPLPLPFLSSGGGDYDGLDDVEIVIGGGEVVITGTTTHFSNLAQGDNGVADVDIDPKMVTTTVGGRWTASTTETGLTEGYGIEGWQWWSNGAVGQTVLEDPENPATGFFICEREGTGRYGVRTEFKYVPSDATAGFLNALLQFAPDRVFGFAEGKATCTAPEAAFGDLRAAYHGPGLVPSGGMLRGSICVPGASGIDWFATLGEPPGSPSATHFHGMLGGQGCMPFSLRANWPPGTTTSLYNSDGDDVVKFIDIDVIEVLL